MVSDLAHQAAINNAVDSGVVLTPDEEQRLISNTDEKVTIFSTQNGEPRLILKIDAKRVLNKRLSNGQPAFWMTGMPGKPPEYVKGAIHCYLDPAFDESDGPAGFDRAWLDKIGLSGRTCNMMAPDKGNQKFRSVFDRDDHAAKKHRNEWKIIQDSIEKQRLATEAEERRLDREAQNAQSAAMLALAGVKVEPKAKPETK